MMLVTLEDLTTHEEALNVVSPGSHLAKPEYYISRFQAESQAAEKSSCSPVSLGVACFVCGWVLQFELNQGNLGGSVIGKARLSISYLDSLHHPDEEQNKQEDEEGGPTWYSLWHQFYFGFRLLSSYPFTKNIRAIAHHASFRIMLNA